MRRWDGRATGEPDSPVAVRDKEQRVVAAQEQALDSEEIAGNDARRLGVQELAPARTAAPRRWLQTGIEKRPSDRAWRDRDAQLAQLADDSLIPLPRVLGSKPQNQHEN